MSGAEAERSVLCSFWIFEFDWIRHPLQFLINWGMRNVRGRSWERETVWEDYPRFLSVCLFIILYALCTLIPFILKKLCKKQNKTKKKNEQNKLNNKKKWIFILHFNPSRSTAQNKQKK